MRCVIGTTKNKCVTSREREREKIKREKEKN